MRYHPHTPEEINAMLATIGVGSIDELFKGIPDGLRFRGDLPLAQGIDESTLRRELEELASRNIHVGEARNFIGAGSYHHYVPSLISQLISRGEFLTAYTPYQPEVSQGTLQAVFEFQTMVSELTGLPIANASNYDLSTACAEALLMAKRVTGKKRFLVARSLHPHYRAVINTYLGNQDAEILEIPFDKSGRIDVDFVRKNCHEDTAAVLVQSPNFFGVVEDLHAVNSLRQGTPALLVTACAEPLSYAVLASPGEAGADIAIAEGMSFGVGLNYGGPYLGFFAVQEKYLRSMPGRIVGQTVDQDGRRGFVLTMSTREQHIRREKATSNICTNQGLCALMCSIYLSLMGPTGLEKLALINMERNRHLVGAVRKINPDAIFFASPVFNEVVIKLKNPVKDTVVPILKDGIFPGVDLSTYYDELDRHLLVCTTEMNSREDVDVLVEKLRSYL